MFFYEEIKGKTEGLGCSSMPYWPTISKALILNAVERKRKKRESESREEVG